MNGNRPVGSRPLGNGRPVPSISTRGSHSTRAGRDRRGKAFQLERTDRGEALGRPRAGDDAHDVGAQDLGAAGLRAEPRRLHDRRAVEVVVLEARVAEAEPDAHLEPLVGAEVPLVDRLLGRHRAGDAVGSAEERGHDPVTGGEHHLAAVALHGLAEDRVVPAVQLVGRVVSQPRARCAVGPPGR